MTKRLQDFAKKDDAVIEVFSEILLTGIIVLAIAAVAAFVLSSLDGPDNVRVDIDHWADKDTDTLYFRHSGGETVDVEDLELVVNVNGSYETLTSEQIRANYDSDEWALGDVIEINTSTQFNYDITDDRVPTKLVHTASSLVIYDAYGSIGDSGVGGNGGSGGGGDDGDPATAPVLSSQTPTSPYSSTVLETVTFSATSNQSSDNEFLLNGTRVAWSNGTSPSYTNTPSVGTYNLTLIAHNQTDPSLTDSISWVWTVTDLLGTYANQIILQKPNKGGIIKDGGYISFTNGGDYRYVEIDDTRYNLSSGDSIKLEILSNQTSGQIDMNIGSSQISNFDFNVKLYVNGNLEDSGQVTDIYVKPVSDYASTLRYELPSHDSEMYLKVDGNKIIDWWPINNSAVNISSIGFYNLGSTVLTFNPSYTYLKCSGYYQLSIPDQSAPTLPTPVSLWSFNNSNANDDIDGNDGNTVSQATWGTGLNGTNGLVVYGRDDYVTVPDSDNLDISNEGSVEAWIYMDEFTPFAGFVHKGELKDFSDEAYTFQFWDTSKVKFGITSSGSESVDVDSTISLNEDQWYHLIGTWNSSTINLYIDGELDNSEVNLLGISAQNSDGSLQIGAQITQNYGGGMKQFGFDGELDEVAIYDYALNATEVQNRYNLYS
ncbi:LamG-like jellyroll fold domain-containing protein [Methanohalophilus sp. WG1-DM]|uniref:LamG-like jellyroll fold domain-containing protein n=1 Tax=Methanohalophilus sp. WG1-DM TaxID=2491675 RepID=UPI000FFF0097|nr:LamG-like jellyroll fold domain-containing protein [Methanohalophilus sp. WG1-DM]RXG34372.1 hypothetical protein CI957_1058 [Methanohalophilus sp. WG1-DM]